MEKIAMKCTREEYESIREFVGELDNKSAFDFNEYKYLKNYADGSCTMFTSEVIYQTRKVYETFNKAIFLKACGIDNNKFLFDQVKKYFKYAVECVSVMESEFNMKDYDLNSLHIDNGYVFIKDYGGENNKGLYDLNTKEYAKIVTTRSKINLLDVEESLGKDTIVSINTRVKKDKRKKMFKKTIKLLKSFDDLNFDIQSIDTEYGTDGFFTITITGNKTK